MIGALRQRMPLLSIGRRVRFRHVQRVIGKLPAPRSALDAGCGDGRLARWLSRSYPAASIVAIDADPELIEANRRAGPGSIDWSVGELGTTPLAAAHFDLVVCVDVMEHIRDDEHAVRWLAQRLTVDGVLVMHVPGAGQRHLRSVGTVLAEEVSAGQGPHLREGYSLVVLRRLVEDAGLEVGLLASTFHHGIVRWAVDFETWIYLRRAPWLKALALPVLLAAQAVERRASARRFGNGCLVVARRPAGAS